MAIIFIALKTKQGIGWGFESNFSQEDFDVELKVFTGEEVAVLYGEEVKKPLVKEEVYVFGRVFHNKERMAYVLMNIKCKNFYFKKEDIKIGWIPRARIYPVYFLINMGEFPNALPGEELKLEDLKFTYEIKKVWRK